MIDLHFGLKVGENAISDALTEGRGAWAQHSRYSGEVQQAIVDDCRAFTLSGLNESLAELAYVMSSHLKDPGE